MSAQIEFKGYWCCLNERESYILSACLIPIVLGTGYVEQTFFYAAFALFGIYPGNAMMDYFIAIYGLTLTEIEIEGVPVLVYTGDMSFWAPLYAFSLTDDFICIERCFELRYSDLP